MKTFISVLVLFALASTLEAGPAKFVQGAGQTSGERIDAPQGVGGAAAVAGGTSQGASPSNSNSGSSSGESNSNGVDQAGGATGGADASGPDADMPDTTDGPDSPDMESSVGGAPIVAQGGVAFGGAGGAGGNAAASSTPRPNAAAPGLIVSDGSSGGTAIAVLCVVGIVGVAAGVGFFIYKRK